MMGIRKGWVLFCLSLVAVVTVPMVGGRGVVVVPAAIAQGVDARQAEAERLLKLCQENLGNNQAEAAIQSCQQAVTAYQKIKDLSGEAKSTVNLGIAFNHSGQYSQAISVLETAVKIAQESKERRVEALAFNNLGIAYGDSGQSKRNIEFLQQALTIAQEINDVELEKTLRQNLAEAEKPPASPQEKEADRLLQQGIQQYQTSQFREALQSGEKALQIYREIKNRQGEASILGNLGNAYRSLGQYQKAIDYQQQSLAIERELGNQQGEAQSLGNLGIAYQSLGEYQKAIDYHQQSLTIARKIKDRQGEAQSLNNLGAAYRSLGQYQKAINYQQQSLPIVREINDQQGEANALGNLGNAYKSLGEYQKTIEYHQKSLEIMGKIGDRSGEAASLSNLGIAYYSLGQYPQAIEYHQKSLDIMRKVGDRSGEAASLGNLGNAYYSLGQYPQAIDYHQQSLGIAREIKDRQREVNALGNLGNAYYSLGQYPTAINYLQQSLAIAKEIGDRQGEASTLGNLGVAYYSLRQYPTAINYYQQSLVIKKEIGDRSGEAASLNNLGTAYQDNKQPAEAIKNLEASLNIYLDMRGGLSRGDRKQFLATNERTVITLAEVLIQQKQPKKAFQWLNLATTADLADYNRLINAQVANPEAQKTLDNWKTNNQQLEGMRRQLQEKFTEELAKQIREFEEKVYGDADDIGKKYPEVAELFETKPTDIAQIQKNIAPNTLVIQPVPLREKIALFLLTKDNLTVIQTPIKTEEFNQLVNQYRNQLADYQNSDYLSTSSKLYALLIRPIETQLKTTAPKNLAIIATGNLRYIPFETLYDAKTDQYLLQKYPISYLTRISTSSLATQKTQTDRSTLKALALANPKPFLLDTDKKTEIDLKGTEKEAEDLRKIFPQSETYLNEKATLDTFKTQASRFPILHLGTHGCFTLNGCLNPKMQANTILFANNQQYNIADAALLGLNNTELITLSACQTAKEANADGKEISGLAYVLERAGAKSVIASLWSAEDNTSAEIMTQFYQNLQKGMSKSEALQKAKLSQIAKYSHPYFWSPFILIGDAQ